MNIIKFNFVNDNMQERINAVNNALETGAQYMRGIIVPQLEAVANSERDLDLLRKYAQGSYLMHIPEIQSYTIIRHCFVPDKGNVYVIAIDKNDMYGFLITAEGWAQFGAFDKTHFEQFQCESLEYIGRTIGDIADRFCTPPVEILYKLYQ